MRAVVVGIVLLCGITQGAEPKSATNSIGMELIEIPGGTFNMACKYFPAGTPGTIAVPSPVFEKVFVALDKFMLGKTEVTQGQWQVVMGTEPWKGQPFVLADNDSPATYVSFFDAVEFCDKLTDLERKAGKLKANEEYRLPTEAQWEYACRAGTKTEFSFGDESLLNSYAWWGGLDIEALKAGKIEAGPGNAASEQYAHKVGMKKPNQFGLHDMHGNVPEWCLDWYNSLSIASGNIFQRDPITGQQQLTDAAKNPVGTQRGRSERVNRGGGWRSSPAECQSAVRASADPSTRSGYLGFRVARSQSAQ